MVRGPSSLASVALLLLSATPLLADHDWERRHLLKRSNTVTTASSLSGKTFDYGESVIVGGGTAGLVMANRLSANSSVTVAVIEAGTDGSAVNTSILAPAQAYFDGIATMTSAYDWHYETVPQTNLNEREIYWPRGKVLGGSSAVNGLYMIRASEIEHNSWATLINSTSTWGWDAIFPYMKKSETYTPPTTANADLGGVISNLSYHGSDGPIHYSYPGFFYPQVANWIPTLANLGIGTRDPAGGESWGAFIATSAIDPATWSRSYSKTGYLDPVSTRANLVVLTGFTATKINFDGTTATGVSFASAAGATVYNVTASQEVILSTGVIGSPQLLQVSGVGPSDLLTSLGIDVVVDLPGVGMHLTDHLSGEITYNASVAITGDGVETNTTIAAAQLALWEADNATSLYNSPNDAVYYGNLSTLFGVAEAATFIQELIANQSVEVSAYSTNPYVTAGYNATYHAEVTDIYPSAVAQCEILMVNTGVYGSYGAGHFIGIQAALQHPLSRGTVKINSTSIFDNPQIDPGYLTHPADIQVLRESFKMARTIGQTAPLSTVLLTELNPGSAVSTDAEWETWIRSSVSTEYHPAGSCSMLPQSLGGVVDDTMRVHGTSNLRIVDSSIVPISFSAHMTAPLYGIAENAYAIMSAGTPATLSSTNGTNSSTSSTSSSSGSSSSSSSKSSSASLSASRVTVAVGVLGLAAAMFAGAL